MQQASSEKRDQYKLQQKRLAQNENPKTKKSTEPPKNIPSACLRFWVETRQLDYSKLRTKQNIIIIINNNNNKLGQSTN